ncbi:Uncharacterized protein OBRU01_09111 [Operophtera brumata]|uniref:Uncharacterized protein n=1 Tax=Operophtera brumata TaxID=104452 RepID=A0A0L7LG50_OPEBR|nr:Uncharacterized protein OBRU01_09111 [Operophtera brumata]
MESNWSLSTMESNWTLSPHVGLRSPNFTNSTGNLQDNFEIALEDTNWILTTWLTSPLANPVVGVGDFLLDPPVGDALMGPLFASFLFQLSFATTATTIVSGAMAESLNPPGGASAFASALMLGPRLGRYARGTAPLPLGNPVNAVMGTFVLWFTLIKNKGRADVMELINSILGSLALLIGMIGAAIASATSPLFDKMRVDDPTLTAFCLMLWGIVVTMALLWLIDLVLPIRMDPYEELLGADLTEHRIRHGQVPTGMDRYLRVLMSQVTQ